MSPTAVASVGTHQRSHQLILELKNKTEAHQKQKEGEGDYVPLSQTLQYVKKKNQQKIIRLKHDLSLSPF